MTSTDRGGLATSLALTTALSMLFVSETAAAQSHVTCVGDSITAGIGTTNPPATAYPAVLQTLLGASFAVENDGHSGATMLNAGDVPYTQVIQFDSSTAWAASGGDVVIQLGTNDSKAANWVHGDAFLADCESLVRHYQQSPGTPRVWLSIPPPASPTACCDIQGSVVASEIVPLVKTCPDETGAVNIDVFTVFQSHMDTLLDGVHPNDEGASVLANTIFEALARTPSVTLSAADAGAGAGVTLTASPTAAYGKVEKVVFFDGDSVVSEVTSSPWTYTVSGVTDGSHVYRAQTIETAGRKADSPPVTVVVADGVPISTQTGTTTTTDDGPGSPPPGAASTKPKSSKGCALDGAANTNSTTAGAAVFFALLAVVAARRTRRRYCAARDRTRREVE